MVEREDPKLIQALKDGKAPMHMIPHRVMEEVALALETGAIKYGERNWRINEIKASTYEGAIYRHALLSWAQGEDKDPESGLHPLSHVVACCLIVMDSEIEGTLIDDRNRKVSLNDQADAESRLID